MAKANLLGLLVQYHIKIPVEVKIEVVDHGKQKGFSDSLLIEREIEKGKFEIIEIETEARFEKTARIAGLHPAEISVIFYAFEHDHIALLDEDTARVFAQGVGVKIKGSLGLLIEGLENGIISHQEAIEGLKKLAQIMYLSSEVYQFVLEKLKE